MTKRAKRFGIKARTCTASGRVKIGERFFASESARDRWISRMDDAGRLVEVVAWI